MVAKIKFQKPLVTVKKLTEDFGISGKEIAGVLDVTPKTLSRWKANSNSLSLQQVDRIEILKSLFELGRDVLGSDESVKTWFHQPVLLLDGMMPIEVIKTESGRRRVESVLHQIEYGFF